MCKLKHTQFLMYYHASRTTQSCSSLVWLEVEDWHGRGRHFLCCVFFSCVFHVHVNFFFIIKIHHVLKKNNNTRPCIHTHTHIRNTQDVVNMDNVCSCVDTPCNVFMFMHEDRCNVNKMQSYRASVLLVIRMTCEKKTTHKKSTILSFYRIHIILLRFNS